MPPHTTVTSFFRARVISVISAAIKYSSLRTENATISGSNSLNTFANSALRSTFFFAVLYPEKSIGLNRLADSPASVFVT